MNVEDALAHLDDALGALTMEGWRSPTGEPDTFERIPPLESTIANELQIPGKWLGEWNQSNLLFCTCENIKQAVIAIVAARQSLGADQ